MVETGYEQRLMAFVGRQMGPAQLAPDPVNAPMIRHWADAFGDANPIYTSDEAARASGRSGIVAPPTMLQAWTMPGYGPTVADTRFDELTLELYGVLEAAGFSGKVATNCEQDYLRELTIGDRIKYVETIDSISPLKQTPLGEGHFVTWVYTYTDADEEVVGRQLLRVFFFRPDGGGG